jgi:hypothetical protein
MFVHHQSSRGNSTKVPTRGAVPQVLLTIVVGLTAVAAAMHAWPSLALEPVPMPTATTVDLPEPASWPMPRHEHRLRFFAVLQQTERASPYQRLARRCNAALDLGFLPRAGRHGTDSIYALSHTHDKWIEADKNPSAQDVVDEAHGRVREAIASGRYDVIFSEQLLPELAEYVERGGIWVVCGNVTPNDDSPLSPLWPARPSVRNSWHDQGAQRGDMPDVFGLPLEHLAGWQWHGIHEAAEGAEALATGQAGAAFLRRVGKGAILLVPTGPISQRHDAIQSLHRAYDHDEIWLRYWDQILHGLAGGGKTLEVVADLRSAEDEATPARPYVLSGKLLNRGGKARDVVVSAHVVSPSGRVVYAEAPRDVSLAAEEGRPWNVTVPVGVDWPTGLYAVYLTIGDPLTKKQLHEAWAFVSVAGVVELSLAADKPGYAIGETATFTMEAAAATPWQGEVRWAVHDYLGRLLGVGAMPVELSAEAKRIPFSWTFANHGVRVDTVWATAEAVKDGQQWARAQHKVYKHDRWNMRDEYQWSTWSNMACQAPSVVPQAMRLMSHAGLNAMGYPAGGRQLHYPAERWSWRIYDEGVGTNTFSPLIESVTDEEIEAAQRKTFRKPNVDMLSGALVLASVGEEAGFKSGWGRTYYWDEPVAPEKACQAFQRFLRERYPSLESLNAAWGTRYRAWDELKLTREFSGKSPTLAADGWAHPLESPLGEGAEGVTLKPFTDTARFYHWYYDKVVGAALKILREEVNPVPLTMASAPSSWIFESPQTDVRLAGGGGWTDSQEWSQRAANGAEPGFAIAWGHFDWPVATENVLWGWVITRSGHNNYWVDVPLMFNPDMTMTRATWAIRRWRARTAHAERLLLDAVPAPTSQAAVLEPTGSYLPRTPSEIASSIKIALSQGGFGFANADPKSLAKHKLVFAVFRDQVSQAEADALSDYADRGGTLVFSQRFAGMDEYGVAQKTSPGFGLARKWGLTVTGKNEPIPLRYDRATVRADLSGLGANFAGLHLESRTFFNEQVDHDGWTALAAYPDQTPALLTRPFGKGRLVYLNAAYQSQWYIQTVTPTDAARQGFYRLIEKLCLDAGVSRAFRIDGDLSQTLHMAALQWTDPSARIGYVVARTQGQSIWTGGKLTWLGPHTACYDVLGGDPCAPAPVYGNEVTLQLRPGAGRLLAFTSAPVKTIKVSAPKQLVAGEELTLTVDILDAAGKPVAGQFPIEVRGGGAAGEVLGVRRNLSLASGGTIKIATALNDPPGPWTVAVRDGISRLTGRTVVVVEAAAMAQAPAFRPWGQPSENWEAERMPADEFIATLRQLADVYRTRVDEDWRAKQRLGAHYCLLPGTRHALLRNVVELNWARHVEPLRHAVAEGANLILVGEDLGLDPATGMPAWPYGSGGQIDAVAAAMRGAAWEALSADGEVIRASLGRGSLVLCRHTPDGTSSSWGAAAAWQRDLLNIMAAKPAGGITAPNAASLARWLAGRETLVAGSRSVVWQGGWEAEENGTPVWRDEWTVKVDPSSRKPGPVFVMRLPPTGKVTQAAIELEITGKSPVTIDVGADARGFVECAPDRTSVSLEPEVVNAYLAWRERECGGVERDLNGWRLLPIRFTASNATEVTVRRARATLEQ